MFYVPLASVDREADLTAARKAKDEEIAKWKWEYENLCKFANDFEAERDDLQRRLGIAEDALGIAEKAIESLTLTQKESGLGLLGTHIVVPETIRRIREALSQIRGEKAGREGG